MENMNKTDIINNKTNLLIITICCALICSIHLNIIRHYTCIAAYTTLTVSDDNFRAMQVECDLQDIINKAEQMNVNPAELFIVLCCMNECHITDNAVKRLTVSDFDKVKTIFCKENAAEFKLLKQTATGILYDMEYFPVPHSSKTEQWVNYVNSWNYERTYKGNRTHEGTDICADINKDGLYPVVSVCDGTVTNVGWLELGGYRIGITSANKIYYYYAHLDSYAKAYKAGDIIHKGELLGYMGSTGYSKVEGTSGKFQTHLHFGMYVTDNSGNEVSINPYWILKSNQNKTLIYGY